MALFDSSFPIADDLAPIDMLSAIFQARGWLCDGGQVDEIACEVPGSWGKYQLRASYHSDDNTMHLLCVPDIRVSADKMAPFYELIARINEMMWLGHFDLWSKTALLSYRHSVLLSDGGHLGLDQAQTLIEHAMNECDRFYPAFQFVLWSDKTPQQALDDALIEAAGEA